MPGRSAFRRIAAAPLLALALAGCQPQAAGGADPAAAPGGGEVSEPRTLAASAPAEVELGREPVTVAIPLSAAAKERIDAVAGGEPGRLRLVVEGLQLLRPGGQYRVYLNLPAGAEPDPGAPHFLGLVAPFASPGHADEMSRGFDITAALGRLRDRGPWGETLRVTFVPAGEEAGPTVTGPYLRFRRIALVER